MPQWLYSHDRRVGGLRGWKPWPPPGFKPQTIHPIVVRCTNYTIPAAYLCCTHVLHYCASCGFLGMPVWTYSWLSISAGSIWEWEDREFGLEIMYSEKVCNSINGTTKFMWIIKHLVVEDENFFPNMCTVWPEAGWSPCTFLFTAVNFSLRTGK